jgi:hypothetical protein
MIPTFWGKTPRDWVLFGGALVLGTMLGEQVLNFLARNL